MITKRDKQLVLQVQFIVILLQSIMISWLIKSEWPNHKAGIAGVILYNIGFNYIIRNCIVIS